MADAGNKPVDVLRAKRGKVPEPLRKRIAEHNRIKAAIRKALADGPKTPPQIAQATGLASAQVFWHLMSMRKYGQVQEVGQDGSYRTYALAEEDKR